jgi:(2S)-methylsuccinyl-CoA dehydrogenase
MAYDDPRRPPSSCPTCASSATARDAVDAFVAAARASVKAKVAAGGRKAMDAEQHAVHGFAWYATYAELFRQVSAWADRLDAEGRFGETEALLAQLLAAEYAAQLVGGVPMNQGEVIRPADLGADPAPLAAALQRITAEGGGQAVKTRVAELVVEAQGRSTSRPRAWTKRSR